MPIPSDQLELLSQQINHAHRSAVSEELSRRGLSEIGHPMLLTILEGYQSDDPEGHAQRDLAELLHISPAAVARSSSARCSFRAAMSERMRIRAAPRLETWSTLSMV